MSCLCDQIARSLFHFFSFLFLFRVVHVMQLVQHEIPLDWLFIIAFDLNFIHSSPWWWWWWWWAAAAAWASSLPFAVIINIITVLHCRYIPSIYFFQRINYSCHVTLLDCYYFLWIPFIKIYLQKLFNQRITHDSISITTLYIFSTSFWFIISNV